MGAYADLERSGHDDVALLTRVRRQLDLGVLRLFRPDRADEERLGDPSSEGGSEAVIDHPVRLLDALTAARAGDGVRAQGRALALDYVGDVDAERDRAAVDERKRQVALARLAEQILLERDVGETRHLGGRQPRYHAKFPDPLGDLVQSQIKTCDVTHFYDSFPAKSSCAFVSF